MFDSQNLEYFIAEKGNMEKLLPGIIYIRTCYPRDDWSFLNNCVTPAPGLNYHTSKKKEKRPGLLH